ncbi:MAG: glycosyltransferase [Patescibacteria group bacterium]|nr:MAG: glycosyltransferase [Patescibacteria group bacterium]
MNIAYVANVRLPTEKAHGLQIMSMCRAFARNGHRVRLVVPKRKNIHAESPWAFYGFKEEFEIVEVPIYDFISHDRILGRFALWLNTLQFLVTARRAVHGFNPDVVYAREPWYGSLAPEVPHVFEAHDFTNRVTPLHRRWWKRAARIVAVTAGLKNVFVAHGVPEEKIVVAHDGVDEATFAVRETKAEARAELGLPSDAVLAIYTGHLYAYKGADDVLDAAASVPPHVRILFVGGRPDDLARLKARAAALHASNVIFAGRVPHAMIPVYLRAADIAVLPTRGTDRHAAEFLSPLKLFEYLAAGKALVATDLPSAREVLTDATAVFVPPSDPTALAKALSDLAASPERVASLERESLRLAANHTWLRRVETVLADLKPSDAVQPWYVRYRVEILCAVLALAIRTLYVSFFPQFKFEGGDGPIYIGLSDYVRGLVDEVPKKDLRFFPIVYPYFLAMIRSVFGNDLLWVRLAQAALSAATVFVGALAARLWLGRATGLLAGVLLAVYAPLVLESGIIYTETTYTFLLTSAVVLGVFAVQRARLAYAFAAGIGFMFAGLTRELGFYQALLFGIFALAWRRSWKMAALLMIPTLLALGGLSIRNAAIAEKHALTSAPLVSKNYEKDLFEPTLVEFLFSPSRWHLYVEGSYLYWRFPYRLSDLGTGEPVDGKTNPDGDVVYHLSTKPGSFMAIQPAHQIAGKWFLVLTHWFLLVLAAYGLWRGRLPKEAKIGFLIAILFAWGTIMLGGLHRVQGFEGFEPLARYRFPTEVLILLLAVSGAQALGVRKKKT